MRKDRGFKGPSTDSGKGISGKSRGNKAGHCFVCGQEGHWKGDQSCPGPPSGTKGAAKGKLTSALKHSKGGKDSSVQIAEHHEVHAVESSLHVPAVSSNIIDLLPEVEHVRDCFVAEHLSEALATFNQPANAEIAEDKLLQAALDSACNRSCAGTSWLAHTMSALQHAPSYVRALIHSVPEQERFRFGNGGQLLSKERVRLPFLIAGKIVLVWISAVPCASLGLLLGKDVLDALGAVHDFLGNRIQFQLLSPDHWVRLERLRAGHSSIPCLPTPLSLWPS